MNTGFKMGEKALLCGIALMLLASCTLSPAIVQPDISKIRPPSKSFDEQIISSIEQRNRTLEDDPKWIENSYGPLGIRKLNTIAEKEYENYKKYIDNGSVYVIVHPAYYPFFHFGGMAYRSNLNSGISDGQQKENAIEEFISIPPSDVRFSLFQAQERRTRDFLEYKSTEEKLVILILPRSHATFARYAYKGGPDEYVRYLNEVTNSSKSIIYVESQSATRGQLREEDSLRLAEFLLAVSPTRVLVGGGYIGRCLEDFYVDFAESYDADSLFMVPELSDISPKELSKKLARSLLMPDGSINAQTATANLINDAYKAQDIQPNIMNLK